VARIRSIKPEFWSDRRLSRLSRDARLLYIGLWNHADEHARLLGDVRLIKGAVFPYDDDLDTEAVARLLAELTAMRRVVAYEADGDPYLYLPTLGAHQRLEPRKVPSRLPEPPELGQLGLFGADGADSFAPRADSFALARAVQVAGSREHVAGMRGADTSARGADGFAEFWAAYPRKVAKGAAGKAWAKAVKLASPEVIIAAASAYAADPQRNPQYTKHPATWLNGQCWSDEHDDDPGTGGVLVWTPNT